MVGDPTTSMRQLRQLRQQQQSNDGLDAHHKHMPTNPSAPAMTREQEQRVQRALSRSGSYSQSRSRSRSKTPGPQPTSGLKTSKSDGNLDQQVSRRAVRFAGTDSVRVYRNDQEAKSTEEEEDEEEDDDQADDDQDNDDQDNDDQADDDQDNDDQEEEPCTATPMPCIDINLALANILHLLGRQPATAATMRRIAVWVSFALAALLAVYAVAAVLATPVRWLLSAWAWVSWPLGVLACLARYATSRMSLFLFLFPCFSSTASSSSSTSPWTSLATTTTTLPPLPSICGPQIGIQYSAADGIGPGAVEDQVKEAESDWAGTQLLDSVLEEVQAQEAGRSAGIWSQEETPLQKQLKSTRDTRRWWAQEAHMVRAKLQAKLNPLFFELQHLQRMMTRTRQSGMAGEDTVVAGWEEGDLLKGHADCAAAGAAADGRGRQCWFSSSSWLGARLVEEVVQARRRTRLCEVKKVVQRGTKLVKVVEAIADALDADKGPVSSLLKKVVSERCGGGVWGGVLQELVLSSSLTLGMAMGGHKDDNENEAGPSRAVLDPGIVEMLDLSLGHQAKQLETWLNKLVARGVKAQRMGARVDKVLALAKAEQARLHEQVAADDEKRAGQIATLWWWWWVGDDNNNGGNVEGVEFGEEAWRAELAGWEMAVLAVAAESEALLQGLGVSSQPLTSST